MSYDVIVRDNPEHHRFDLLVDGVQAGFSLYTDVAESAEDPENPEDQRIFHHTVVDEAFGGWQAAQKKYFADGGIFDKIFTKR